MTVGFACKYTPFCYAQGVFNQPWRGMLKSVLQNMFDLIAVGMLGGMVALIFFELIQEVRGSAGGLHDHYHE
jgi:hypothetical protein